MEAPETQKVYKITCISTSYVFIGNCKFTFSTKTVRRELYKSDTRSAQGAWTGSLQFHASTSNAVNKNDLKKLSQTYLASNIRTTIQISNERIEKVLENHIWLPQAFFGEADSRWWKKQLKFLWKVDCMLKREACNWSFRTFWRVRHDRLRILMENAKLRKVLNEYSVMRVTSLMGAWRWSAVWSAA